MTKYLIPSLILTGFFLPVFSSAATSQCANIINNLSVGSEGDGAGGEVTILQTFLKAKGYFGEDPTGYFGSITETAVRKFQKGNGIYDNGFVGPITRAKIKKLSGCAAPAINGTVGATCGKELKLCSDGSYSARAGASCAWTVCPTTSAGNSVSSSASTNSGASSGVFDAEVTTYTGPIPSTLFGRTVVYKDSVGKDQGVFVHNWYVGNERWFTRKNIMYIIRFKTDEQGAYLLGSSIVNDGPTQLVFVAPTPGDYTWAYNRRLAERVPGSAYPTFPVLTDAQATAFYGTPESYDVSYEDVLKSMDGPRKRYLLPNTYYYYHIVNADVSPYHSTNQIKSSEQLASVPDTCAELQKEQMTYPDAKPPTSDICTLYLNVKIEHAFDKNRFLIDAYSPNGPSFLPFPWTIQGKSYASLAQVKAALGRWARALNIGGYNIFPGSAPVIEGISAGGVAGTSGGTSSGSSGQTQSAPLPPDNSTCSLPDGTSVSAGSTNTLWYKNGSACYSSGLICRQGAFVRGLQFSPPPPEHMLYHGGEVFMDSASCN